MAVESVRERFPSLPIPEEIDPIIALQRGSLVVDLRDRESLGVFLANKGEWMRVIGVLTISFGLTVEEWADLARVREHVCRPRELYLLGAGLRPETIDIFIQSALWAHADALDLSANLLGSDCLERLLVNPYVFAGRQKLVLRRNALGPEDVQKLIRHVAMSGVFHLDLSENHIGDEGARALASCENTLGMTLKLDSNGITARGLAVLLSTGVLRASEGLSLANNPLGPEAGRLLAASTELPKLEVLDLSATGVDDEALLFLATGGGMWDERFPRGPYKLKKLYLDSGIFAGEVLGAFAGSKACPRLEFVPGR